LNTAISSHEQPHGAPVGLLASQKRAAAGLKGVGLGVLALAIPTATAVLLTSILVGYPGELA
jgi:hypothetical protein